jgi:ferredoxin-NADP reductase
MTALQLLAYISTALLFQIAAGVVVVIWRKLAIVEPIPELNVPDARASSTGAWAGWRDFRVVHRQYEDAANSQCSFHLQPVDAGPLPDFKPGQYLTFALQIIREPNGAMAKVGEITRCYSLSNRPNSTHYQITIKRMAAPVGRPELPPGAASSYFLDRVQEGDVLKVKAPAGHFFIDPDASIPAVFIAGGIGITPMMSMLEWCIAEQPARALHLYYGVYNSSDHAFKEFLEALAGSHPNLQLHVVYGNPGPGDIQGRDYQHVGYINLELLRNSLTHGRHQFYLCGPPPMMQSLLSALRAWSVNEDDIRFEAFGPASMRPDGPATNEPLAATSTSFDVRLNRSERTLVWDGQDANLLDFAERQGVALDSGCRSGSCGSCETKLISGTVHYINKPDYDIAKGYCLPCIGKPQSALVLDL